MIKKLLVFLVLFSSEAIFSASSKLSIDQLIEIAQDKGVVIYRNGHLHFKGFTGQGRVEIFSIIGNKIFENEVLNFSQFQLNILLKKGNMYIVRIIIQDQAKTFKIVAS